MQLLLERLGRAVSRLWAADRPLTAIGLLMIGALGASFVGLAVDPRLITGAPAWLKPAKFAVSTAIYSLTLAWVFMYLPAWRRTRMVAGWMTALIFVFEVGIIDVQAWRGTASHFNVGTPLDATLFALMGLGIVVQTLASVAVAVALWRTTFSDEVMGWALRLGMTITLIGAGTGAIMTRPTAAQLAEARTTHHIPVAGAHTVGAPDGGAGLPGTGWSREHGDLRVPHFFGLHALQALALMALLVGKRRAARPVRLIQVTALSYVALFVILLWQAFRGESIVDPNGATLTGFAAWAASTAAAVWIAGRDQTTPRPAAAALLS
jgi:hypothetical protein